MRRLVIVASLLSGVGCLDTQVSACSNGRVCPVGLACDLVHDLCLSPQQLTSCSGISDGQPCTIFTEDDGVCRDEVCLEPACGDGYVASPEEDCEPTDGLTLSCTGEEFGFYRGEVRCGADCLWDVSECSGICQDGIPDLDDGEECDGDAPDETCLDFGYDVGATRCNQQCFADRSGCQFLGWRPRSIASDKWLSDIWVGSDGAVIAVGHGSSFHLEDGLWVEQTLSSTGTDCVWGWSATSAAVAGVAGVFFYDGVSWTLDPSSPGSLRALWGSSPSDIYVSTGVGLVYHYDGSDWSQVTEVPSGPRWAIHGSGPNDVWLAAVGVAPALIHFNGEKWEPQPAPAMDSVYDIWSVAAGEIVVLGAETITPASAVPGEPTVVALFSLYDGNSYQHIGDLVGVDVRHVAGTSASDIVAVGPNGAIVHYDGALLREAPVETDRVFDAVATSGPGQYYAAGAEGGVFEYEGAQLGRPLATAEDLANGSAVAVSVPHGDVAYTVGAGGGGGAIAVAGRLTALDLETGAASNFDVGVGAFSTDVVASTAGDVWFVNDAGAIYYFDGDPPSLVHTAGASLNRIWLDEGGSLVAVGANGLVSSSSDGMSWTDDFVDFEGNLHGVWGRSPSDIYAVGDAGSVFHFDGAEWTRLDTPMTVDLADVDGDATGLVVGGAAGALWYFDGASWIDVPLETEEDILSVAMTSPVDLWAGAVDGLLWAGTTAGVSPVRLDSFRSVKDIDATSRKVYLALEQEVAGIDRTRWWNCTPAEVHCGDGGDDDCDGLPDDMDPSCAP